MFQNRLFTVIGLAPGAFSSCSELKSVALPNTITYIGNSAFSGSSVISVSIPNSVKSIGENVFARCYSLTTVNLPDDIKTIQESTFYECRALEYIIFPNGLEGIGRYAFEKSGLKEVNFPKSLKGIGYEAFLSCSGLISLYIPNNIESIEASFQACINVNQIIIEDGDAMLSIGGGRWSSSPFSGCNSLEEFYVGRNLYSWYRILEGPQPKKVTIGEKITSIGDEAFLYNTEIVELNCLGKNPPALYNANVFSNSTYINATVNVPIGSLSMYQNAEWWNSFWNIQEKDMGNMPPMNPDQCAIPRISLVDGKLAFESTTENSTIQVSIQSRDSDFVQIENGGEIELNGQYLITAVAFAPGLAPSPKAQAVLIWITPSLSNSMPALYVGTEKAIVVTSIEGGLQILGTEEGQMIEIYDINGLLLGQFKAMNETTDIPIDLSKGNIYVVRYGRYAVKYLY